jgi:glycosidase
MIATLDFWLARGVDGFRIDVAHYLMKDPDLRDNPPNEEQASQFHKSLGAYSAQLHVYDRNHSDIHDIYREIRCLLERYGAERPRVSIGEIHLVDLTEWSAFYGEKLDELHMPFNFTLLAEPWKADAVRRCVDAMEAALPSGAWPNWVLGNHDEHRIATRVGEAAARTAMMLLLSLRGTPTLYYGDELGMVDVPVTPDQVQDPWERRVPGLGLGRDPERSPMQWDDSRHAGFTRPDAAPWLPVAFDAASRNVAVQSASQQSMLSLTRGLLALRREHPALHLGSYRPLAGAPEGTFVFERACEGERLAVLLNFEPRPACVTLPGRGRPLLSTHPEETAATHPESTVYDLRPHEGVIIELLGRRGT